MRSWRFPDGLLSCGGGGYLAREDGLVLLCCHLATEDVAQLLERPHVSALLSYLLLLHVQNGAGEVRQNTLDLVHGALQRHLAMLRAEGRLA